MEKRFSLENIISGIQRTVARFPLPAFIALLGTVIALVLFDDQNFPSLVKLLLTLVLVFPLSVGVTAFGEHYNSKIKASLVGAVVLFAVTYYFFIARNFIEYEQLKYYIQYGLWILASVSVATFLPFLKQQTVRALDFWFYNQRIVYAFLATFIYSAVLFIGLVVAMTSFSFLFDVTFGVEPFELWIIVVGIFCPLFFLSRYPSVQDDSATPYPDELRKFAYYILVPLVALYFIILYSYTIKILISWEWPKGIISYMILGFSTLGIITYTILYPLIVKEERLQKFSKIFFIALLPQVAVLLWAVWMRVADYGITENRYLLVVFGVWLLALATYFLANTRRNISVVPTSLFVILILISFGPWGMFSVSVNSQVGRLESIFQKNDMLVDGKAVKSSKEISTEDSTEINNIVIYLIQTDNLEEIQPWFTENLKKPDVSVTQLLDIKVAEREGVAKDYLDLTSDKGAYDAIRVKGYDYVVMASGAGTDITAGANKYRFELDGDSHNYTIYKNGNQLARVSKKDYFTNLLQKYSNRTTKVPAEELSFTYENSAIKMKVYFTFISGSLSDTIYSNQIVLFSIK